MPQSNVCYVCRCRCLNQTFMFVGVGASIKHLLCLLGVGVGASIKHLLCLLGVGVSVSFPPPTLCHTDHRVHVISL